MDNVIDLERVRVLHEVVTDDRLLNGMRLSEPGEWIRVLIADRFRLIEFSQLELWTIVSFSVPPYVEAQMALQALVFRATEMSAHVSVFGECHPRFQTDPYDTAEQSSHQITYSIAISKVDESKFVEFILDDFDRVNRQCEQMDDAYGQQRFRTATLRSVAYIGEVAWVLMMFGALAWVMWSSDFESAHAIVLGIALASLAVRLFFAVRLVISSVRSGRCKP